MNKKMLFKVFLILYFFTYYNCMIFAQATVGLNNPCVVMMLQRPADRPIVTRSVRNLTSDNISSIFTSKLKGTSNLYVAKAVAYLDNSGRIHTIFWSIGNEDIGIEVHHRDALGSLLREEKSSLEDLWLEYEEQRESLTTVKDPNDELNIDSLETLIDDLSDPNYESVGTRLSLVRNHSAYTPDILSRSQGFFFVAEKDVRGELTIREFHINSSITAAQIAREDVFLDVGIQQRLITSVLSAIDSNLKKIKDVKVRDVAKFRSKLNNRSEFVYVSDINSRFKYKINNLDNKLN